MTGAIVISKSIDGIGEYLDPPGRGLEAGLLGIRAERLEKYRRVLRHGEFYRPIAPKTIKIRHLGFMAGRVLTRDIIHVAKPVHLATAIGKGIAEAEALGEIGIDIVLIARVPDR